MTCEEVSNDGLRVIIQDGLFVACAEWSSDLDERILCRTTIGVLVVELFSKLPIFAGDEGIGDSNDFQANPELTCVDL